MNTSMDTHNFQKWCALGIFLVGSYTFLVAGLAIMIDTGSVRVGLPLILLGGIMSVLSTFFVCVAYWLRIHLRNRSSQELNGDAPPSYRATWRKSFFRQGLSRNQLGGQPGRTAPGTSHQNQAFQSDTNVDNRPSDPTSIYSVQDEVVSSSPFNTRSNHGATGYDNPYTIENPTTTPAALHSTTTNHEAHLEPTAPDLPPSYDAALAAMDDVSLNRVVADFQSPSISNND